MDLGRENETEFDPLLYMRALAHIYTYTQKRKKRMQRHI